MIFENKDRAITELGEDLELNFFLNEDGEITTDRYADYRYYIQEETPSFYNINVQDDFWEHMEYIIIETLQEEGIDTEEMDYKDLQNLIDERMETYDIDSEKMEYASETFYGYEDYIIEKAEEEYKNYENFLNQDITIEADIQTYYGIDGDGEILDFTFKKKDLLEKTTLQKFEEHAERLIETLEREYGYEFLQKKYFENTNDNYVISLITEDDRITITYRMD